MSTRTLRKRYTRVVKQNDKWTTYLQIDHQGFCVVYCTTKRRAQWHAKMLTIALERLITRESKLK